MYRDHGVLLDPHSAVGVHAANLPQVRAALGDEPTAVVLTAHPAKFESASAKAGVPYASHPNVDALKQKPHAFRWLRSPPPPADKGMLKLVAWAAAIKRAVEARAAQRQAQRVRGGNASGSPADVLARAKL